MAIAKQLYLLQLDWDLIAKENDIPTGNAARMRWGRYRTRMDPESAAAQTPSKRAGKKNNNPEAATSDETCPQTPTKPSPTKKRKVKAEAVDE
jgi:hypothetical protein